MNPRQSVRQQAICEFLECRLADPWLKDASRNRIMRSSKWPSRDNEVGSLQAHVAIKYFSISKITVQYWHLRRLKERYLCCVEIWPVFSPLIGWKFSHDDYHLDQGYLQMRFVTNGILTLKCIGSNWNSDHFANSRTNYIYHDDSSANQHR